MTGSSLEVVRVAPKILGSDITSDLLEVAEGTYGKRVTDLKAKPNVSIYSLTPELLCKLIEVTDIATDLVQFHWNELPDKLKKPLRNLLLSTRSETKKKRGLFSYISYVKAIFEFEWLRLRCGERNLTRFIESSDKLKSVLSQAIKFENSAEARAIERLKNTNEFTEWVTVIEEGKDINMEELKDWLAERGYSTDIQLPSDQTPES